MPWLGRDGAHLYYRVDAAGPGLLAFAPGGVRSVAALWREHPDAPGRPMPWFDPVAWLSDRFCVVTMDQRNAGASSAPVRAGDGWDTYAADQLALMDELGMASAHLLGSCAGASLCLAVCRAAPERVLSAVLQNPIGRTEANGQATLDRFDEWAGTLRARRGDVGADALAGLRANLYGGDFVYSASRQEVARCRVPLLVLAGDDEVHPRAVAEELVALAPHAELVTDWRGPQRHGQSAARVRGFLLAHTPDAGRDG